MLRLPNEVTFKIFSHFFANVTVHSRDPEEIGRAKYQDEEDDQEYEGRGLAPLFLRKNLGHMAVTAFYQNATIFVDSYYYDSDAAGAQLSTAMQIKNLLSDFLAALITRNLLLSLGKILGVLDLVNKARPAQAAGVNAFNADSTLARLPASNLLLLISHTCRISEL